MPGGAWDARLAANIQRHTTLHMAQSRDRGADEHKRHMRSFQVTFVRTLRLESCVAGLRHSVCTSAPCGLRLRAHS
jgi:hypothetical protein